MYILILIQRESVYDALEIIQKVKVIRNIITAIPLGRKFITEHLDFKTDLFNLKTFKRFKYGYRFFSLNFS